MYSSKAHSDKTGDFFYNAITVSALSEGAKLNNVEVLCSYTLPQIIIIVITQTWCQNNQLQTRSNLQSPYQLKNAPYVQQA